MVKPVVRIKLTTNRGINVDEFTRSRSIEYSPRDQRWIADCTYTSFEGAKRFSQFHSMYKVKALFKAYEWLKEQRGLDAAMELESKIHFALKINHRSYEFDNKHRITFKKVKNGYSCTLHKPGNSHRVIGYGPTQEEALKHLETSKASIEKLLDSISNKEKSIKPKSWWQFWRS